MGFFYGFQKEISSLHIKIGLNFISDRLSALLRKKIQGHCLTTL